MKTIAVLFLSLSVISAQTTTPVVRATQNFVNQNPWLGTGFDGTKYRSLYFSQGATLPDTAMGPNTQDTMTVTMDIPFGAGSGSPSFPPSGANAIAGYAFTHDNRVGAIGVFGSGFCSGTTSLTSITSCWGGNFMGGTRIQQTSANESVFGAEMDINLSTPNALNAAGVFVGGASAYQVRGTSAAYWVHQLGGTPSGVLNRSGSTITWVSGSNFDPSWAAGTPLLIGGISRTIASVTSPTSATLNGTITGSQTNAAWSTGTLVPFNYSFYAEDGTSSGGILLGALTTYDSNLYSSSNSQALRLSSRNAGTSSTAVIQANSVGTVVIGTSGSLSGIPNQVGGVIIAGGPVVVNNSYVQFPSYTYLSLPTPIIPAGGQVYCSDCSTSATCTSSGNGHMALSNGVTWKCQ